MSVSFTERVNSPSGNPNTKATNGIPVSTGITSFPENLIGDKGDGHFIQKHILSTRVMILNIECCWNYECSG